MSNINKGLVLAELKKILANIEDKDLSSDSVKNLLVFGNDIEIDLKGLKLYKGALILIINAIKDIAISIGIKVINLWIVYFSILKF